MLILIAPISEPTPTVFDRAILDLSNYLWNRGKTTLSIPIDNMLPPDPLWGARRLNPEHVNVRVLLFY